jgi:hypothetical protein
MNKFMLKMCVYFFALSAVYLLAYVGDEYSSAYIVNVWCCIFFLCHLRAFGRQRMHVQTFQYGLHHFCLVIVTIEGFFRAKNGNQETFEGFEE